MEHIAIMKKSWGLLEKITMGEKVIESRWYKTKHTPWGKIQSGETVYFKNSGEAVTVKSKVQKVLVFENLDKEKVRQILNTYGELDGIKKEETEKYYELFKDKKYCLHIFLEQVKKIQPFKIDKTGFGAMAAWICTPSVETITKT